MSRKPSDAVQPMSLRQMRAYLENPPPEAEQTRNGVKPVNRMKHLADRYEDSLFKVKEGRYNNLLERAKGLVEEADDALDLLEEQIDKWSADLASGRMTPDEVLDNVRQVPAILKECQQDYDTAQGDAEAGEAFIQDDDLASWEDEELARFPVKANSLPRITEAWLTGDDDTDPLGVE